MLRSIFEEALKDSERCRRALTFNDYPQAVFYAQQCVEKCAKTLFLAERVVEVSRNYLRERGVVQC